MKDGFTFNFMLIKLTNQPTVNTIIENQTNGTYWILNNFDGTNGSKRSFFIPITKEKPRSKKQTK
jgi:hypothetical protein